MKGVLVAVGLGERVARRTRYGSRLLGRPLERPPVDAAIDAFARAGFEEIAVIVGHREDVLWQYLEDSARYDITVYCLHNAQHLRGNVTAIYAARAFVGGEPFVVSLSSCAVTTNLLLSLRGRSWDSHAMSVEVPGRPRRSAYGATQVWLDEQGRVRRVGQRLKHWHALSTGAFLFQPDVFGHVAALLRGDGDCSMCALIRQMIACGEAPYACDVSPQWKGILGDDRLLAWTMPMLTARLAPQFLAA